MHSSENLMRGIAIQGSVKPFAKGENKAIALLALLFIVATAFVLSHHHSYDNPINPDEAAYHGWAKLYGDGQWSIPISDWYGVQAMKEVLVENGTVRYLSTSASGSEGNAQVAVTLNDGTPASGAKVRLMERDRPPIEATCDASGVARFTGLKAPFYPVVVNYGMAGKVLHDTATLQLGDDGMYRAELSITGSSSSGSSHLLIVSVTDSFGTPMSDVELGYALSSPGQRPPLVVTDTTDETGNGTVSFQGDGLYVIGAEKGSVSNDVPIGSVVEVDGQYEIVNRWAPGYSILMSGFMKVGAENWITIFLSALCAVSIYVMARRLFGWKAAAFSAALMMTCGLCLLNIWTKGMADYATMSFGLFSMTLFVEAVTREDEAKVSLFFALCSGLALGGAVWIRYTTGTLLLAPVLWCVAMGFWNSKKETKKYVPTKREFVRFFKRVLPLLVGIFLLLIPLFAYNAHFFGHPLRTGYMYSGRIELDSSGGNETALLSEGYYQNFKPSEAISTMPSRLFLLAVLAPFIYIAFAVAFRKREKWVLLLFLFLASNFFLYIFVPWAGAWDDPARSMEDMRYFLPGIPAAAALAGYGLSRYYTRDAGKKIAVLLLCLFLVVAGFGAAQLGIGALEMRLHGPGGGMPGMQQPGAQPQAMTHELVNVTTLLDDAKTWNGTLVEVRNCTLFNTLQNGNWLVTDGTHANPIAVTFNDYAPPAVRNETFTVKGMFRWIDRDADGVPSIRELNIGVKGGTQDGIFVSD